MKAQRALTRQRQMVVQAIYDELLKTSEWPTFAAIDRPLRRRKIEPLAVLKSIPSDFMIPLRHFPQHDDVLQLTVQGVALCEGGERDVGSFLRIIRWAARCEIQGSPGNRVMVTSVGAAKVLRVSHHRNLGRLRRVFLLLQVERWGSVGSGWDGKAWTLTLDRDVWRFRRVMTLDQYLAANQKWMAELAQNDAPWQAELSPVYDESVQPNIEYVDTALLDKLISTASPKWNCGKLGQIVGELNDCYMRDNGLAAHALLRTLLDHVPPLFKKNKFSQVAEDPRWSRTDRRHMARLTAFVEQADDALHRQIARSSEVIVPSVADLPGRLLVNRLLQGCLEAVTPSGRQ